MSKRGLEDVYISFFSFVWFVSDFCLMLLNLPRSAVVVSVKFCIISLFVLTQTALKSRLKAKSSEQGCWRLHQSEMEWVNHFIKLCCQRKARLHALSRASAMLLWALGKVISIHEAPASQTSPTLYRRTTPPLFLAEETQRCALFMWLKAPVNQHFWASLCETFPARSPDAELKGSGLYSAYSAIQNLYDFS